MMGRKFTQSDDERIRAAWPDVTALAVEMGRRRGSLSARGKKLGLPAQVVHRPVTDIERDAVIERYRVEGPRLLAREFGRKVGTMVAVAQRLGVATFTRWSQEDDARLCELKKQGLTYAQIGLALGRSLTATVKRAQVLELSVLQYRPEKVREEYQRPHVRGHMGPEARWARERIAMGEHGWMPDLNPKEIAILESLRSRGPQGRRILAKSIGEPADRNPKKLLMTHGGRSALARIMARGLVARLRIGGMGRERVDVYTLTGSALAARGTFQSVREFNAEMASWRPGDSKRVERRQKRLEKQKELVA